MQFTHELWSPLLTDWFMTDSAEKGRRIAFGTLREWYPDALAVHDPLLWDV